MEQYSEQKAARDVTEAEQQQNEHIYDMHIKFLVFSISAECLHGFPQLFTGNSVFLNSNSKMVIIKQISSVQVVFEVFFFNQPAVLTSIPMWWISVSWAG